MVKYQKLILKISGQITKMINSILNLEVSDTTGDAQGFTAGQIIFLNPSNTSIFSF